MEIQDKKKKVLQVFKIALIVFLIVFIVNFLFDFMPYGRNGNNKEDTIVFTGHGEVNAVPDIANINFTIRKEAKTVKEAQNAVAEIEKKALEFLKTNEIALKDIKTVNASFNPKYEYQYQKIACSSSYCPPAGRNVIVGYEAYENLSVKIRNTDNAGKIIEGIGGLGVSELNGPNFTVDNEDDLKATARKEAINDAKNKAKVLAKDLGVKLGKIVSFSEQNNSPVPMYDTVMLKSSIAPERVTALLPKGENIISSDVTITYRLR